MPLSIFQSKLMTAGLATAVGVGAASHDYFGLYSALTKKISDPKALHDLTTRVHAAEVDLLRIDWKAAAPVVFCNEFSINWDPKSRNCIRP
ncbi:MAG: hypothetical protein ABIO95_05950 [Bdellovibrionota bacterium]